MSKQKNYEVLKYNEPAFVGAGVAIIMAGLLEKNPALNKEADAVDWVRHMNLLKAMAEEVVVREVIYSE